MMEKQSLISPKRRKIDDTVRHKIEHAVSQILIASDLETTTEFSVRSAAEVRLGFELSDSSHRRIVRQLVDSFLFSSAADVLRTASLHRLNEDSHTCGNVKQQQLSEVGVKSEVNCHGKIICKLSDKRSVAIHGMNGTTVVSIGDFVMNDGIMLPERDATNLGANSGISLTATEWSSLKNSFPSIQEAILKLESRSRSVAVAKHIATGKSQTEGVSKVRKLVFHPKKIVPSEPTQKQIPATSSRNAMESNIASSVPPFDTVTAVSPANLIPTERKQNEPICPERLIPLQTTRFYGKNYHFWKHQMESFLKQLNIAYVLSELCPITDLDPAEDKGKDKVKMQKWIDDDYMCRHNILNSLSDDLFQKYSDKSYTARELWKELKSVYDDDFGTKSSRINKYIHFQMVDGVSVLEQVEELHQMADSVIASGTYIEESFHSSVIVSKLPPSWKDFRRRLMKEDFLPVNMLMHRIRVEEEFRHGRRKNGSKRVCYICGKEGHISKECPDKRY